MKALFIQFGGCWCSLGQSSHTAVPKGFKTDTLHTAAQDLSLMFTAPFKSTPILLPQDKVIDKIYLKVLYVSLSIFGEANHFKMCASKPGRTSLLALTCERTMFNVLSRAHSSDHHVEVGIYLTFVYVK